MKLNFDESQGVVKKLSGGIVFVDYPNQFYTVSVDGIYLAAAYPVTYTDKNGKTALGYDTLYFDCHGGSDYYICKVATHDGCLYTYEN